MLGNMRSTGEFVIKRFHFDVVKILTTTLVTVMSIFAGWLMVPRASLHAQDNTAAVQEAVRQSNEITAATINVTNLQRQIDLEQATLTHLAEKCATNAEDTLALRSDYNGLRLVGSVVTVLATIGVALLGFFFKRG
jgi:uncharacterized membrane protein YjgN (DUF898 family)